jgi:hypothetical protein
MDSDFLTPVMPLMQVFMVMDKWMEMAPAPFIAITRTHARKALDLENTSPHSQSL